MLGTNKVVVLFKASLFFSARETVSTPFPVKSSVLHRRPVLSRFYLRVQQSSKNMRK